MSWVTDSWRLKLAAIGLAVLMLGAVAFAQNPPTFKTLTVSGFQWTIPTGLIVINAPTKTTVRVTGLADTIQTMTADRLIGTFDLSKVSPGPAVKVNLAGYIEDIVAAEEISAWQPTPKTCSFGRRRRTASSRSGP